MQHPSPKEEVTLAYLVGLRSAMRAGEILSLGKSTLDLERRVAEVKHKMQYLTGRPRQVPLTRHASRLLRPVAQRERCFSIMAASQDTLFRKSRDRLLIEDLHFHDSRAEALTRLSRSTLLPSKDQRPQGFAPFAGGPLPRISGTNCGAFIARILGEKCRSI